MSFMYSEMIVRELQKTLAKVNEGEVLSVIKQIQSVNHIFCDGLGRSGLVCRSFAMRLMQLGLKSMYVGDTTTTAICEKDMLLICSGSGESVTLISHAKIAKTKGALIVLLTGNPNSTLGKMADYCIAIQAPTKEIKVNSTEFTLPMGSLFEITSGIIFENCVLELMNQRNETSHSMFMRHANIE